MRNAIVSSVIANKPLNGGNAWVVLSWALGLKRLGLNVHVVEQIQREHCINAVGERTSFETSVNLAYFRHVAGQFGLAATLVLEPDKQTCGTCYEELRELVNRTDVLVNITGHLTGELFTRDIKRRVYLDLDPGFTQYWQVQGCDEARLAGHDFYFTIGENIGAPDCTIPQGDIPWHVTRQPIVLDEWGISAQSDVTSQTDVARFTTIATWRGPYGPVEYGGKTFGLKVHEFRKFLALPARTPQTFEIALDIHPAETQDLRALAQYGWHLSDPKQVACDPFTFRQVRPKFVCRIFCRTRHVR